MANRCSFCGERFTDKYLKDNNMSMIQSAVDDDVLICFKCSNLVYEFSKNKQNKIEENEEIEVNKEDLQNIKKPSTIKEHLDNWIIGQEKAKKDIATAVYNHSKMLINNKEIEIEKSNILLIGPTGTGKTSIVKALGKLLDIPYVITDSNSLTQNGYVGRDVEDILKDLLLSADGDLEKAQKGIIYLDEIDKIGRKGSSPSGSRDISGEGVQQALLKLIEGGTFEVKVGDKKKISFNDKTIKFDTSSVLFIAGGSFEGIEKTIRKRINKQSGNNRLGFCGNVVDYDDETLFNEILNQITPDDLRNFGMLPELLGRFPVLTTLEQLSEEAMVNILTEPKNALVKQYSRLLEMDNIELEITSDALKDIAKKALNKKTGARALRSVLEEILKDSMYIAPDMENLSKIIVTKEAVENPKNIKYINTDL